MSGKINAFATLGWTKKFKGDREKGGAWVYTHPNAQDGRAIVQNHHGVFFAGKKFGSLFDASNYALQEPRP